MNYIVKIVGSIIVTLAILGLPVLSCLSFVLEWPVFFRLVFIVSFAIEAMLVAGEVYDRSEK